MPLDTNVILQLAATLTKALDLGTGTLPLGYKQEFAWPDGTGADKADLVWHDQRQLAASANEELDLAGVLTDAFGTTLTFAKVTALVVFAKKTNTNNVIVGGAAANALATMFSDASDKAVVRPGGLVAFIARDTTAYAVTAGTGDKLKIENSAGGSVVDYEIVIVGRSA